MAIATPNTIVTPLPGPKVRLAVSVLVSLHVFAVFLGPWAMPPSSDLATGFRVALQPYLDLLSLGNGYRFFAPEPGPSHLIRFEVTLPDGTLTTGMFPDRQQNWPRLLYHRYFMLSEFLNTLERPGAPRDRAEAYARSYAQHLVDTYQADSVRLYLRRHYVPRMAEVQQGLRLSDKSLYEERLIVEYTKDKP